MLAASDIYPLGGLILGIIGTATAVGATVSKIAQQREAKQLRVEEQLTREKDRLEQMIEAFSDQPESEFAPARPGVLKRLNVIEIDVETLKQWRDDLRDK